MAMTSAQAIDFIEKSEELDPKKVDLAKLREAIEAAPTRFWSDRGKAIIEDVGGIEEAEARAAEEAETAKEKAERTKNQEAARATIEKAGKTDAAKVNLEELAAAIDTLNFGPKAPGDTQLLISAGAIRKEAESATREANRMTRAEGRAYIEQAERMPLEQIDEVKLRAAIEAVDRGPIPSLPEEGTGSEIAGAVYADRGKDLLKAITTPEEEEEVAAGALSEPPPGGYPDPRNQAYASTRVPGRGGGAGEGSAAALRPGSDLINRLDQAAKVAGKSADEVQQVIAAAQAAAVPWAPEVVAGAAAAGQTLPEAPTVEALLQDQIMAWMGEPIGVAPDYIATREIPLEQDGLLERNRIMAGRPAPTRTKEVLPQYQIDDEWNYAYIDPALIPSIQQQLVDAGLMEPGEYYAGTWTDVDAAAMRTAMGIANASGYTVDETIQRLIDTLPQEVKDARAAKDAAKVFQAPPYMEVDSATIAQDAKTYARNRIGREPTDTEMAEISAQMSAIYRQDYEAEVAALRSQFDQQVIASETGVAQTPGSFPDVDPAAQFKQYFDQRFGPEINRLESLDDVRNNMQNVFGSLGTLGRVS